MPHEIIYEVGTLAVDGWAVAFGTARRGLGGAAARPILTSISTIPWIRGFIPPPPNEQRTFDPLRVGVRLRISRFH